RGCGGGVGARGPSWGAWPVRGGGSAARPGAPHGAGHASARAAPGPGSAEAVAAEAPQLAAVPLGGAAGAAVAARRGGEGLRRRARRRRRGAVGVAAHRDRRADPLLQDVADVDDPGRAVQPEPDLVAAGYGRGGLRWLA